MVRRPASFGRDLEKERKSGVNYETTILNCILASTSTGLSSQPKYRLSIVAPKLSKIIGHIWVSSGNLCNLMGAKKLCCQLSEKFKSTIIHSLLSRAEQRRVYECFLATNGKMKV